MRKKEAVSGWRLAVSSDSNRASRTHALRLVDFNRDSYSDGKCHLSDYPLTANR